MVLFKLGHYSIPKDTIFTFNSFDFGWKDRRGGMSCWPAVARETRESFHLGNWWQQHQQDKLLSHPKLSTEVTPANIMLGWGWQTVSQQRTGKCWQKCPIFHSAPLPPQLCLYFRDEKFRFQPKDEAPINMSHFRKHPWHTRSFDDLAKICWIWGNRSANRR